MQKVSLLALLFLSVTLVSCSSDDDGGSSVDSIVGLWKLDTVTFNGEQEEVDECSLKNTADFAEDGVYTTTTYDCYFSDNCTLEEIEKGTWEFISGNTYQTTTEGQTETAEIIFSDDNKRFTTTETDTFEGEEEIYVSTFVRQ